MVVLSQAPLADKSRPLGARLPFTATTTNKADFVAPSKGADRYHKPKHEAVPSAPLTNATMYRWDCWILPAPPLACPSGQAELSICCLESDIKAHTPQA